MNKTLFLTIIICTIFDVNSQQKESIFSQYYTNQIIYNPAISGSKNYNEFTLQTRQQWIGFEGSPLTVNLSGHGLFNNRSGIGGFLEHDRLGEINQTNLQLNYAYHVPLNAEGANISLGIGAKAKHYYINLNPEDLPPGSDPVFGDIAYENFTAYISPGLFLYNNNLYIGYSITNLLQTDFNSTYGYGFSRNLEEATHYGQAGYKIQLDRDWFVEPSILIRNRDNGKAEYNFSGRVFYSDQIWTGISARSNKSLSFSLGTNSENIQIAYSFDHYFGEISNYNMGTHELTICVRIPNYIK